ncbi:GMC family oxidoreductase [Nocardioides sp. SOB77]|uniref:Cholesterol oxidase n=1 Tax=Nocardioides oceani TaxID=3058369 RepID=A0ABT8FJ99_9ACTN|nr:GMC family oxidoreductase [Nocardioides oceani]MDN4174237.1 GMC family oxidoreductase [Nocardioides oceani]
MTARGSSSDSGREFDHDVVVIGSGFGGSVTALRLAEKGYHVAVLEAGARFEDHDLPRTSWRLRRYVFAPRLGLLGIQRMTLLRNALVISGAGVGGGSLVYGATLYEPPAAFYDDPHWRDVTDWRAELAPHYDQAKRMLGVTTYDRVTPADRVLRDAAADLGAAHTWRPTDVGVLLGPEPGRPVPDPYFGGAGPDRRACLHCGECMTGCRHNAKNTLPKNYLHLAEAAGATVHPLTTVTDVRPLPGGGYAVSTRRTGGWRRRGRTVTAEQVVLSAAALGTQRLLHHLRDSGSLPHVSPRLGELTRTNSEAGLAVRARGDDVDYTEGVAISSSVHLDERTHVEPCRYGRGSNAMGMAMATMTDPVPGRHRALVMAREMWRGRRDLLRLHVPRRWSEQSIGVLVMQSIDNSLTTYTRRRRLGRGRVMTTRQGIGEPNPTHIPEANAIGRAMARRMDGIPGAGWTEVVDVPTTAHFLGGCPIGADAATGVIDPWHRLHGHPGLHVVDGSAVAANLGVNPSLTITAMAERAMSFWPNRGEPDPRPPLGTAYIRLAPVPPRSPAVPASAPGALRLLPITPVPARPSDPARPVEEPA